MFPSWKFFDESNDTPVLLYSLIELEKPNEWKICIPPPEKKWFHFLLNPKGNYYLAYNSHIQQLLGDLENCADSELAIFHQCISYEITEHFVHFELQKKNIQGTFQFKLSNIKIHNQNDFLIKDDILISPILEIERSSFL